MTNLAPGQTPGYGSAAEAPRETDAYSGTGAGADPTNEPGQYPASLFGVALPQGTGAMGSAGAGSMADPTNEPGQLNEGISGLGPSDTADTGAPGSQGGRNDMGGTTAVKYTRPGSYLTGTFTQDTVVDNVSGPGDWTQAIDGSYAGSGPDLPGIAGNQPTSTGAGGGRVLRGGYRRGQR